MKSAFAPRASAGQATERWLPLVVALIYWVAMYPGLFGEDSLITLGEARSGQISVWFTAWWVYVIQFLTFGTAYIPLLTLMGVLVFAWSVRVWATAVFPPGPARTWAIVLICATPLVGAIGIQVRHDAWMTAGLLLCLAVAARFGRDHRLTGADYIYLLLAAPLIATRHNGLPTVAVAAVVMFLFFDKRLRPIAGALAAVATVAGGITFIATRSAGHTQPVDPVQSIEWLMADVSCLLTKPGVDPTAEEWARLESVATRKDWPQPVACDFVNPLFIAPSFHQDIVAPNVSRLVSAWWSLTQRYPLQMVGAHFGKLSLFLPPFVTGSHERTPFIHSTILPNDFGLAFAFPRLAEAARLPARAWNAGRIVLANTTIWLAALWLAVRRRDDLAPGLRPALLFGIVIELALLVTAPTSEGRYGLLMLVTGQLTLLYLLLEKARRPA